MASWLFSFLAFALLSLPSNAVRVVDLSPPKLCDAGIVRTACARLNVWSAFVKNRDVDLSSVHATEIAQQLTVARSSVLSFFKAAGIENMEQSQDARNLGAFAVDCQELCEKTVAMIPEHERPPTSDVACYRREGSERPVCDIDVSDSALDLKFPDHSEKNATAALAEVAEPAPANSTQKLQALEDVESPEVHPRVIRTGVANLFRIYPLARIALTAENDTFSFMEIDEHEDVEEQLRRKAARAANDAECQASVPMSVARSGWHLFGNDCKCPLGTLLGGQSPECATKASGLRKFQADELAGKGCSCRRVPFSSDTCVDRDPTCSEQTGRCHLAEVQDRCPVSCDVDCGELPALTGFAKDSTEVAVKAQVYVAKAVSRLNAKAVPSTLDKWFGNHDMQTRNSVLRVLNGINQMLMNVEYVYPGESCDKTTYAYVYPSRPRNKNSRGQYIFHLCPYYMEVGLDEKIETLTHEGSHHEPMYTDDECLDGETCNEKAYGRGPCRDLARRFPGKALNNADNFCYFVNDAAQCTKNC